ncbi:MAG: hypothetical protein ACFE96_17515, partial [Candidatus Hermodarchaeota archaeon]
MGVSFRKRQFIFFLVLILFFSIFMINFNHQLVDSSSIDQFSDSSSKNENLNTAANDPNGKPLLVNQYANISRTFTNVGTNQNISFPIASGWVSKNTTIYYEGVERKEQWITNSDFASTRHYWGYSEVDTYSHLWQGGHVNWDVDGHTGSVWFGLNGDTTFAGGDCAGYIQNFSISSESMSEGLAVASFDYYYDVDGTYPDASMFLSITINGVEKLITRHLNDVTKDQWETISVQYNAKDLGQTLPGTVSVYAGLLVNGFTFHTAQDYIYLDNIRLELWTNLTNIPGVITTYDVTTDTNYPYFSSSEGYGYSFINTQKTSPGEVTFTIFENISPGMDFIEFNIQKVSIFSPAQKIFNSTYFGKDGSCYTLSSPIKWATSVFISLPTYYNSWIEILKPMDWSFTSIVDGIDIEQIGECLGKDYGSSRLIIPHGIIGEGVWDLKAESQNEIIDLNFKVWDQTQFENQSHCTQSDVFKIDLSLNSTLSLLNSELNCTIFYPNRTLFLRESLEPTSHTVEFGNYYVGTNMSVGKYLVEVTWQNSINAIGLYQVGYANLTFTLWHHTNLTTLNSYYELVAGSPLLLKVNYIDIDSHTDIDFASVRFNSSYGLSGTMAYQGLGTYFVDLDTSSLGLGDYYFSFNASKSHFENQSRVNLIQLSVVPQPLALEFDSRIVNATGNSYATCKVNVIGELSGIPQHPANVSCNWENGYSIFDNMNGSYIFNFSTYGLPTSGVLDTFEIEIFANKTNYGSTSDFITLIVRPISTLANVNNTNIYTYINDQFEVKVNYTVEKTGDLISGGVCSVTWDNSYDVNPVSDGIIIRYYTSGLNIDIYNSLIRISKPGYEDALISITVVVNEMEVNLTVNINGDEIAQDDLIELLFEDSINLTSRVFSDREGKFLTGGLITLLSENYQANLTEYLPSYFSRVIVINGDDFNSGLNTIYIRFEQENYTTKILSFQFFIRTKNVILDVKIDDNVISENFPVETHYNEIISISCRAFAEVEAVYLSGGIMQLILDSYEFNITEYDNYWYNDTISISTNLFSLGNNYVYVKFE